MHMLAWSEQLKANSMWWKLRLLSAPACRSRPAGDLAALLLAVCAGAHQLVTLFAACRARTHKVGWVGLCAIHSHGRTGCVYANGMRDSCSKHVCTGCSNLT
jgi:hypothetical protein